MAKINFRIKDLTCDACIKLSNMALKKIPGVKNVEVKSDGAAIIESENDISQKEIVDALASVDKSVEF